jgi:KipI family sensor histidine kinase inhibitor
MAENEVAVEPFGDAAILIRLVVADAGRDPDGDAAARDLDLAARSQAIAAVLAEARAVTRGIGRAVPAAASVLLPFDPLVFELDDAIDLGRRAAATASERERGAGVGSDGTHEAPIVVPVHYGGDDGPDLASVAEHCGLTPAGVVEMHAGARYRVLFLGFAPGFGYLGGLPAALETPRRPSPRDRVPAGSIGIAGRQTAIYPRSMPGGWQLIGRTQLSLFDPDRSEPALLRPGATVRFMPATR